MNRKTNFTQFGRKVKKKLIDKEMTQVELASRLGCRKQYINQILVGKKSGKKYMDKILMILEM